MLSKHLQMIAHGLLVVAAMLALIAAALWLRPPTLEPQACAEARVLGARDESAGIPDSGKQRQMMIEQLETLNRRLADIERALRDGSFTIQTVEARGAAKAAAPAAKEP